MQRYSDFFKTLHDEISPTGYLGRGTHYSVLRAVVFHDALGKPLSQGRFANFAVIWDEDHDVRVMEPIEEVYRQGLLSSFLIFGEHKGSFTAILSNKISSVIEANPFNPVFLSRVRDLELSVRAANCFSNDNIVYIGDLVRMTEAELIRLPNMGRKALDEIKQVLIHMDLSLGMEAPGWPPENVEVLVTNRARVGFLEAHINKICQSLTDPWTSTVVPLGSASNPIISDANEKVGLYLENLKMLWQLGIETRQQHLLAKLVSKMARRGTAAEQPVTSSDGIPTGWTTDPLEADNPP
jgi:RNA polymerase alpha subunit